MSSTATRSRQSTPIKAIVSTINSRSAPSIPPSDQLYDPLPKAILRRRLLCTIFPFSALFVWVLTSFWAAWQRGGVDVVGMGGWLANAVSPATLALTGIWWMVGAVPVVVLRKTYVSASPSTALSPQQTLQLHIRRTGSQRALIIFIASSFLLSVVHSITAFFIESDTRGNPHLGLFSDSDEHPLHVNGRLLYLLLTQFVTSLAFWFRDILQDRFAIKLLMDTEHNISQWALLPQILPSAISTTLLSTISTLFATIIFAVSRTVILPVIYRIPLVHGVLRPFIAHFFGPRLTVFFLWTHFNVIVRAYMLNLTTSMIWDVASVLFTYCSSVPVRVTSGVKDSALRLVSGVESNDPFLQLHAIHELYLLASDSSSTESKSKRMALFEDMKYNPSMWGTLVRKSLLILGKDYQALLRRGKPVVPATVQSPAATAKKEEALALSTPMPLIRRDIYKSSPAKTPSSPLAALADSMSANGALTQALKRTTNKVGAQVYERMPSPRKMAEVVTTATMKKVAASVSGKDTQVATNSSGGAKKGANSQVMTVVRGVKRLRSGALWKESAASDWWSRERKHKMASASLPNKDVDVLLVRVLSNLVVRSLTEDTLGVVQRDIPRILESFLTFLGALESYSAEFSASEMEMAMTPEEEAQLSDETRIERERFKQEILQAKAWIGDLIEPLQTGVGLIVQTFGDKLMAFKFPPKIAKRLQGFVDYL